MTPAAIRGRLSSVQQVTIITGLTGAFIAHYQLAAYAGSSTAPFWVGYPARRWMFWLQRLRGQCGRGAILPHLYAPGRIYRFPLHADVNVDVR